jgi:hypothetical protein
MLKYKKHLLFFTNMQQLRGKMEPIEIATTWKNIADGNMIYSPDIYFKFMALWVSLNCLYASKYGLSTDRACIDKCSRDRFFIDHHEHLVNQMSYINSVYTT